MFWKQHLWRLLAWPLGAAVVLGLGWFFLISKAMPPAEAQPVARNFVLQEA